MAGQAAWKIGLQKESRGGYFVSLQILRGLAALAVALLHIFAGMHDVIPRIPFEWLRRGQAGVDTFFVLSGFVIAVTINRFKTIPQGWREFAWHRIARIIPLYWILTTIKVLLAVAFPSTMRAYRVVWANVLSSYLLVPFAVGFDGTVVPVLSVAWTLLYEALFYAIATLSLALGLPQVRLTAAFFVPLAVIGLFHLHLGPGLDYYAQPFVLEFVAGILIARLAMKGWFLPPPAALSAIVLGVLFLCFVATGYENQTSRVIFFGIPGVLFTAGFVGLERFFRLAYFKAFAALGDASYAIYITHTQVLAALLVVYKRGLFASIDPFVLLAGFITIVIAVGIAAFHLFERPVKRELLAWWHSRYSAQITCPATGS